jgi:hypothetical protein
VSAGQIRDAVAPFELLRAVGNLSIATGEDAALHSRRMVDLLVDGLRFGAPGAGLAPRGRRGSR